MIKMIVSDIDGTLVPEGASQIAPEVLDVIRELKARGILFVAASGRQYESIRRLLEPVADDVLFIAENGGRVVFHDENISVEYIEPELAAELILFLRRLPECEIMLATPTYTWLETKDEAFAAQMIHGYKFRLERTDDLLTLINETIKIAAYRRNGIQPLLPKIRERFERRMNIVVSGEVWADCMSPLTDKGYALEKIQRQMNISADETMVFGDNCNDIQMIRHAAWSYAVANAHPQLLETARFVAPSSADNGVVKTIREQLKLGVS